MTTKDKKELGLLLDKHRVKSVFYCEEKEEEAKHGVYYVSCFEEGVFKEELVETKICGRDLE